MMSAELRVWMPSLARITTSSFSSGSARRERSISSMSAPVSAERRKCRRGSFLASSQLRWPAAASLSISGASEWSSLSRHDLGLAQQVQRAVADAHPFHARRPEHRADQRAAHAVERRVLLDALADGGIGELERIVEPIRHLGRRRRRQRAQEHAASGRARQRSAGMAAHAVGENRGERSQPRPVAGASAVHRPRCGRSLHPPGSSSHPWLARLAYSKATATPSNRTAPTSRTPRRRTARRRAGCGPL